MRRVRIGHSPDPDDAFMWYPLANFTGPSGEVHRPQIDTGGFAFEHVMEDIESLNQRSERGELEVTALSIHQFPYVADRYVLTSCGSSMGDGYGPIVVTPADREGGSRDDGAVKWLKGKRLAIPGVRTSAWLSMQLRLAEVGLSAADVDWSVVAFDEIPDRVLAGEADAGLLIHEGQLTYEKQGLRLVEDLGKWWTDSRGLPLPLGGNAIRKDLGDAVGPLCGVLLDSIEWALEHRAESVGFALQWARGMGSALADEFVGMYVNDWTLDYGERGRAAVTRFIEEGVRAGLVPDKGAVAFAEPERG
ncbi:1,4-dihydroxy-6-naphtoate synthase [Mucisphaera calidilacus]|uniref:1,4-dihydroxy-6-naphtoate synthase n=2 Tax=Mucisphaera calidilacus TaxID=2527982 RepID=A0A518C0K2_9BACT|nr:1,4-dihydroxy-6-naphtoate synthase [Mucisphaera calidilacus]